ncbi:MAG: hypothetical protein KA035_03905 [Candidatus Levybacteria bacterium]|nr:hypothetical protein [Candidatus Levybacteria bacterium]
MAKKKNSKKESMANIIGWYGALATLSAYFLVSFEIVSPRDLQYQLLNLSGAIGLGTICYVRRTYQPLFVNIIWSLIAILALVNILVFVRQP